YRADELALMKRTFDDPHAPYHALRRAFVRKEPARETPPHLTRRTAPAPAGVTGPAVQDSASPAGPC
ncbi:hydrogenase maturation protein, partial [Streptomyces sp. NPDC059525]